MPTSSTPSPAGSTGITRLAQQVRQRLHPASGGRVCKCGPCRHQLVRAAARFAIEPAQVLDAIAAVAAAEQEATALAGAGALRGRRPLHAQVGAAARVVVDGRVTSLAEGLLAIAATAETREPAGS